MGEEVECTWWTKSAKESNSGDTVVGREVDGRCTTQDPDSIKLCH